jgi:hypothetical protein
LSDESDRDIREFLLAALAVEIFMLVFFWECKVYDLSTAMFTAFLLGWLARGQLGLYHGIFPFACINRETAFLLIIIFAVYSVGRLTVFSWIKGVAYQALVYLAIRIFLVLHFAGSTGEPFWFRPADNLQMYIDAPLQSIIYLAGMVLVLWVCLRRWKQQPALLRTAFLVMAPSLAILYMFFGFTFEIRAFAEVYPVIVVMSTWRL